MIITAEESEAELEDRLTLAPLEGHSHETFG